MVQQRSRHESIADEEQRGKNKRKKFLKRVMDKIGKMPPTDKKKRLKKLKDHSSMDKLKQALENKIPTTVSEARALGWKPTGIMKMSDPPKVGFEKDGKVIWIQEKKDWGKNFPKKGKNQKEDDNLLLTPKMMKGKTTGLLKKGGKIKVYAKGGGVRKPIGV